jgi:hypothetical protein
MHGTLVINQLLMTALSWRRKFKGKKNEMKKKNEKIAIENAHINIIPR